MAFHEIEFPRKYALGSTGGPGFATSIITTDGGHEQRNQPWSYARGKWDVSQALKDQADYDEILAFFLARNGKTHGFRFWDHRDHETQRQLTDPASGDGAETEFQLQKVYADPGGTYTRKISKPIEGTVRVYVNAVRQTSGWTVNLATGLVTFGAAPSGPITATCWFHVPVRFDIDTMPTAVIIHNPARYTWGSIPLVEIRV